MNGPAGDLHRSRLHPQNYRSSMPGPMTTIVQLWHANPADTQLSGLPLCSTPHPGEKTSL